MADIRIQSSGAEHDDVYDQYGEKMGVAVYDLGDAQVRANIVKMKDELKALGEKYDKLIVDLQKDDRKDEEGMPLSAIPIAETNLDCVNEMVVLIDKVFGKDFCINAVGDTKNPNVLWEVIGAVMENYGVKAKDEMSKYTNRAGRRAAAKASE